MTFVDTHAHLYLPQFDNDRHAMLDRAVAAGCEAFLLPNIDSTTIEAMLVLEAARPDVCFAMMGLHPSHVKENFRDELALCEDWLRRRRFAAVGEIGIDLYWDKTYFKEQLEALHIQMGWAKKLDLPVVLHTRDAMDVVIEAVAEAQDEKLRGVFHCFNGNVEQAERIAGMGFYLGIGGVLTYKNGGLEPVIEALGLEYVVLETDAPYLAPIPMRGKRNESAYITHVIERLANLTGLSPEEVGGITTANARRLFAETLVSMPVMD